jgi:hypothetical protein
MARIAWALMTRKEGYNAKGRSTAAQDAAAWRKKESGWQAQIRFSNGQRARES